MNVKIFKPAAFASIMMMALAACTNEVVVVEVPENDSSQLTLGQGEDLIKISLSNTTGTRAARPIGSSEATNEVNRIAFKFLTTGQELVQGIKLEGVIDTISGDKEDAYVVADSVLNLPANYKGEEICVMFSGLKQGSYKLIAYGYNYTSGSDTNDAFPYKIEVKGSHCLLKCENVTTVQEIFAGSNENSTYIEVNQHGKFTEPPVITLKRQVAGLLAYFKNVPAFVNNKRVEKVTVSAKTHVTGFYFPASLVPGSKNSDTDDMHGPSYNGIPTSGWYGSTWVNYLTFDMKQASNYSKNLDNGEPYEFNDSYLLAEETEEIEDLVCEENTLFGSRFLLAYPQHIDLGVETPKCATLNICYWDKNGDLILSVPLRNGGSENDSLNSGTYQYDILCNNFYSIGTKKTADNSDSNDNPLNIDEPTGYDYAKVTISSNWEDTHDLFN